MSTMDTVTSRPKRRTRRPSPGTGTSRPRPQAAFMRNDTSPFLASWQPALREASDDVRQGYVRAAARTIDMVQNSGWIAGAVDQSVAYTIGAGLRLASKPDVTALRWTVDEGAAWAQNVERRWEAWASRPFECD